MSQRDRSRPTFPLLWECPGGSVTAGESSLEGAIREVFEEVGVSLHGESGRVVFSRVRKDIGGKRFNDIMDVWLFHHDGEASLEDATTDEVSTVQWMTRKEIKSLWENGMLVPTLTYFFDLF